VGADAGAFLSEEQLVVLKNRAALEAADAQLKSTGRTPAR
jgi:hypothetical protein